MSTALRHGESEGARCREAWGARSVSICSSPTTVHDGSPSGGQSKNSAVAVREVSSNCAAILACRVHARGGLFTVAAGDVRRTTRHLSTLSRECAAVNSRDSRERTIENENNTGQVPECGRRVGVGRVSGYEQFPSVTSDRRIRSSCGGRWGGRDTQVSSTREKKIE